MLLLRLLTCVLVLSQAVQALAQPQPPSKPAPQDEYVPLDQLPPQDEMPASLMVIAAYSFVWLGFVVYLFTVVRRIRRVESDLRRLEHMRR